MLPKVVGILVLLLDVVFLNVYSFLSFVRRMLTFIIPESPKDIHGEAALITGAGHGLGRELAIEFSKENVYLILWDINQAGLQETEQLVKSVTPSASVWCDVVDVSVRDDVRAAAHRIPRPALGPRGGVSILINNAGILIAKPLLSHEPREIEREFAVNVMSHFWTIELFLADMKSQCRGHIVAIASAVGKQGVQNLVPYSSTKFAVTGLMDALTEELRMAYNNGDFLAPVYTTTVFPGVMNTGLIKRHKNRFNLTYDPKFCARKIVDGIRRNKEHIYIPAWGEAVARSTRAIRPPPEDDSSDTSSDDGQDDDNNNSDGSFIEMHLDVRSHAAVLQLLEAAHSDEERIAIMNFVRQHPDYESLHRLRLYAARIRGRPPPRRPHPIQELI